MNTPAEDAQRELFGNTIEDNTFQSSPLMSIRLKVGDAKYLEAIAELDLMVERSESMKSVLDNCSPIARDILVSLIVHGPGSYFGDLAEPEELIG